MSLFDLQDVCIAIGSLATLDLPMVVDLIGVYGLKGPYSTLTTTDWFLQALSVIPRGSWGDVARRFTMIRWTLRDGWPLECARSPLEAAGVGDAWRRLGRRTLRARRATSCALPPRILRGGGAAAGRPPLRRCSGEFIRIDRIPIQNFCSSAACRDLNLDFIIHYSINPNPKHKAPPLSSSKPQAAAAASSPEIVPAKFDEENPSAPISSGLLVQADEGIPYPVVDLIDDIYRRLP
ncbi:hypothetical protein F511_30063 [Dorcoceras hygrometricum]|uniref:DNA-directed RNA polymerase V subunit 1 n=1 Tax=Dorcoceras hygrometricum TaxID=472368 RepID=A0A2Z7BIP8_9LAMI|nr:hypothetical protein F511_30063 [Dorcoceras hygrometricum]